jgi:hypothetical protein
MNSNELQSVGQKLEVLGVNKDVKARRVLNTAPDTKANITAEEIEKGGITIEKLESLNVPVYTYTQQATIHGIVEGVYSGYDSLRYKSIIRNGNGSTGVKFIAIDAKKKNTIANMIEVWYSEHKAFTQVSSQGFLIARPYGSFESDQKAQYMEAVEKANKDLEAMPKCFFGGAKVAYLNNWGLISLYLICELGAIYEKDVNTLVEWFTGHTTEETLAKLEEKRIKREQERQEWTARYEESKRIDEEKKRIVLDQLHKELEANPPTGFNGEGTYLYKVCVRGNDGEYRIKEGEITYKKTPKGYTIQYGTEKAKFYGTDEFDRIIASPAKKLWKKGIEKKVIQSNTVQSEGITVSHNTEKNGVEIKFKSKPSQSIIDSLKANGFRWSYHGGVWYNKYSQKALDFANSIVA